MDILIIEDNYYHWKYVTHILKDESDFNTFPIDKEGFKRIRKNINTYQSPKAHVKEKAKENLLDIFGKADFFLMDYELSKKYGSVNCIDLYVTLNLEVKALIFTKYKAIEFDEVKSKIKEHSLGDRVAAIQKPANLSDVYKLKRTQEFLIENIKKVAYNNDLKPRYKSDK